MSQQSADAGGRNGPLRIGYLLRMYPRFSQTFIVNEILELEQQGVEIGIASLRRCNEGRFHDSVCRVNAVADYIPERILGGLGKTFRVHKDQARRAFSAYMRTAAGTLFTRSIDWIDFIQAAHVLRWARKNRINHLHVHFGTNEATVAMLAHAIGGLSYSLTLHAFDIFRNNVNRALLARKINMSRFTITVSEYNRRWMIQNLPGVSEKRIRVNYNGIDLSRFKASDQPRELHTIFSVGRLIEKKGYINLVRAVGRLRDEGLSVRCKIAGDGVEKRRLIDEISRLGLKEQVALVGPVKQQDVREIMQTSSCFALPCVRAKDGNVDALPTVLLESLASGCPTVSTRISGVPEILEHRVSGLLVEPDDDKALAGALRDVLTDRALAATLAIGGRRRAEQRFDIRANVATMRDWLADASRAARGRKASRKSAPDREARRTVAEAS